MGGNFAQKTRLPLEHPAWNRKLVLWPQRSSFAVVLPSWVGSMPVGWALHQWGEVHLWGRGRWLWSLLDSCLGTWFIQNYFWSVPHPPHTNVIPIPDCQIIVRERKTLLSFLVHFWTSTTLQSFISVVCPSTKPDLKSSLFFSSRLIPASSLVSFEPQSNHHTVLYSEIGVLYSARNGSQIQSWTNKSHCKRHFSSWTNTWRSSLLMSFLQFVYKQNCNKHVLRNSTSLVTSVENTSTSNRLTPWCNLPLPHPSTILTNSGL